MLEKATIARPYAEAAFSQALDEGKLGDWSKMLGMLAAVVTDAHMRRVIHHPQLGNERLYQLILDVCELPLEQTAKNFIRILIEADRIGLAREVFELFEQKRAAAEGIRNVAVIAAYPLTDEQRQTIAAAVSKRIGKDIDISTEEDAALIGGVIIRLGDAVIDASLRGRLKALKSVFAQ